jgi:hypothetical protein
MVLGHIFIFCAPVLIFGGTEGVRLLFLIFVRPILGSIEGVGSRFHVLRFGAVLGGT